MNYYKETENFLKNYNALKISIEISKKELQELQQEESIGISAVPIKERVAPTNDFNSATEDEAISRITQEYLLKRRIEKTTRKVEKVDMALNALSDIQRAIIEKYYIEGKQWYEVAWEVGYCERWCREQRSRAIENLSVAIFSDEAIRD